MVLKDGTVKTFEVSPDQFHKLRLSVAKTLYEMRSLESHPIHRIINEFRKKDEEQFNT